MPHRRSSRLVLPDDTAPAPAPAADPAPPVSGPDEPVGPAAAQVVGAPTRAGALRWVKLGVVSVVVTAALMFAGGAVWQLWLSDLWGGYQARRAAERLEELEENPALVLPAGMTLAMLAEAAPSTTLPPQLVLPPVPPAPAGQPIGRIVAPAAGLDATLVSGTTRADLVAGPGWMAGTAFPGMPGNSVVSGHRTTYGGPFRNLDRLRRGDRITVEVPQFGTTVFEVRDSFVVAPGDVWVASGSGGVRLTLTTCHPVGSDRERYVVQAEAVEGPAAQLATPAGEWSRSTPA